jgi:hypothetical protein
MDGFPARATSLRRKYTHFWSRPVTLTPTGRFGTESAVQAEEGCSDDTGAFAGLAGGALMGGYLLFYAILFTETAYILPRLYARSYADLPAERFRAE